MPCYDGRENERQVNVTDEHEGRLRREWMHNSPIAELLCSVMKKLTVEQRAPLLVADPKLAHWWRDHQERDKAKADKKLLRKR